MRVRWILCGLLVSYAAAVHIALLRAIPDPIFHPDSAAYLRPTLEAVFKNRFALAPERSAGYPYFLYAVFTLVPRYAAILLVQHLLQLLTAAIAAGLYYRLLDRSLVLAGLIFFAASISPISVLASHTILTETLYAFFCLCSIALVLAAMSRSRPSLWFLLGLSVTLALWVRPSGWALVAGCGVAVLLPGVPSRRRAIAALGLALALGISACCLESYKNRGFFGLTRFGGVTLFGAAAKFLEVEKIPDAPVREILTPLYGDAALREQMKNNDWARYAENGPVKTLAKKGWEGEALDRTLMALSARAIRQHPVSFFAEQVRETSLFLWHGTVIPEIFLTRQYTFFVYRGLILFWRFTEDIPEARRLLVHQPADAEAYHAALSRLMQADEARYASAAAELEAHDVFRYDKVLRFWQPFKVVFQNWRWIPTLAFLMTLMAWREKRFRSALEVLWIFITAHIALSMLSAPDPRYGIQVEPLYFVILALGCSVLIKRVRSASFGLS